MTRSSGAFNHPDPEIGLRNAKHLAGLLDKSHPAAANSPLEGLEQMFAVKRIGMYGTLAEALVAALHRHADPVTVTAAPEPVGAAA